MTTEQFNEALAAMDPAEVALGAGFAGAIATLMIVGSIVWFFVSAIGFYKMYVKAGVAGWKAFIPYYRSYVRFSFAWNTKMFWPFLVGALVSQFFTSSEMLLVNLLVIALGILTIVIGVKLDIRVAKSFGKSTGWGVGLFFLPFIFSLILGFGKAQYIGNTTVAAE